MRLYAWHTHQTDAAVLKGPIRLEKLVILGCVLSSNAVKIVYIFFAVFRKIWASMIVRYGLEQHDDLCWGPMRSITVITGSILSSSAVLIVF